MFECVCVCLSAWSVRASFVLCVFKQDTNIDCSLIILPSALFTASINSLMLVRHIVDTKRKDKVVEWRCNISTLHTDKDINLLNSKLMSLQNIISCRILTKTLLASDRWLWEDWEVWWIWELWMCIFRAAVQERLVIGFFHQQVW